MIHLFNLEAKNNYFIKKEDTVQLNIIDFIIFSIIATLIPSLWLYYQKLSGGLNEFGIIFVPLLTILVSNTLFGFFIGKAPFKRFYLLLTTIAINAISLILTSLLLNSPDFDLRYFSRYFPALLIFYPISLIGLFIGMKYPVNDTKLYRKLWIIGAIIIAFIILLIMNARRII